MPPVQVRGLFQGFRPQGSLGRVIRGRRPEVHWALQDVSLSVHQGETLGVAGGNGSGKSTLLRCINGVLRPMKGEVVVLGPVVSLIDLTAGIQRDLTGHETLLISGVLQGLSRDYVRDHYQQIVDFSGLDEQVLDQPLHSYSMGMFLRLAISVVLHSSAAVYVIDEVLAVADEAFKQLCLERLSVLKAGGCAVVQVSHDLDLLAAHSDRVAILEMGKLAYLGSTTEGLDYYRSSAGFEMQPRAFPARRGRR